MADFGTKLQVIVQNSNEHLVNLTQTKMTVQIVGLNVYNF